MENSHTVIVDRYYLDELKKKALAWDELQEELSEMYAIGMRDEMNMSLSLGDSIDRKRAVPFDQTIIVTGLPSNVGAIELMYSFLAPGGIRCYKMFFESTNGISSLTALITFAIKDSARNYLSYVSKCGTFFVSERLPLDSQESAGAGGHLKVSTDKKFQFLIRPFPAVKLSPWTGVERVADKLITGNEGGYCNVTRAINQGATRVLMISPGMEPKELHDELRHLVAIPELKIELNRLFQATPPAKGMVTVIRFCSVRDAVMAKNYLSLLKGFSSNGRTVKYCKDPTDHPTEELGWHALLVTEKESNQPTSSNKLTIGDAFSTTETENLLEFSDTEESDSERDMREYSFYLAKEAFLPHIPTSPNRGCFTTLCHTPAPGDHTPAEIESEPQPEKNDALKDHLVDEMKEVNLFASNPDIDDGAKVLVELEEDIKTDTRYPDFLEKPKYPKDIYLSQGKVGGGNIAYALKMAALVKSGGVKKPKSADSLSGLGRVMNTYDLDESPGSSVVNQEVKLGFFLRHQLMLLRIADTKAASEQPNVEPGKQTLETVDLNQSQDEALKSDKLSLEERLVDKLSTPNYDGPLAGWGDDF